MSGSPVTAFTDFVDITGPSTLTDPGTFINDAVKNTNIIRRFLKGKDHYMVMQGGDLIQDFVMFDEKSTFDFYSINAEFSPANQQVLVDWQVRWRHAKDEAAWTKHELLLNTPQGAGRDYIKVQYKRFWDKIQGRMWTSYWKGMEDAMWALPDSDTMESAAGEVCYSIPAHVNEFANGLYPTLSGTTAFTTLQGINPATDTGWVPVQRTYMGVPPSSTTADWDLWDAMNEAYLLSGFEQLPDHERYSEPMSHPHFMATDLEGYTNVEKGARSVQNVFRGYGSAPSDPYYPGPQFASMDILYVSTLDAATLYDDGASAAVTQANADAAGPRYYGINGEYLCPVWHSTVYADMTPTMTHPRQPFSYVKYLDTWFNLPVRSRKRHFSIAPSQTLA